MSEAYFEDICHALHAQDAQVPMHETYSLAIWLNIRPQWPHSLMLGSAVSRFPG